MGQKKSKAQMRPAPERPPSRGRVVALTITLDVETNERSEQVASFLYDRIRADVREVFGEDALDYINVHVDLVDGLRVVDPG